MTKLAAKCPQCYKTVVSPSRASMTAWLFGAAQCQCETEKAAKQPAGAALAAIADAPHSEPRACETIGSVIDERYEVLSLVGQGGMGAVYRVFDRRTKNCYALKRIAPEFADQRLLAKRLEYEAQATKALTHPNIVPVYDVGSDAGGAPYLIMDYVEGRSLEQVLQADVYLPPERALNIFIQVAEGLAHAHSKGIVHRDLKPSNILLSTTESGNDIVKLVDFGIAKMSDELAGDRTKLTQTGQLLGSPPYMSPEQSQGSSADARSDIYSLGCVMYEVVTGKPPFCGDNPMQILFKHVSEEPPALPRRVPSPLATLICKCLEKDPKDRYQACSALLIDLKRVASGKRRHFAFRFNKRRMRHLLKLAAVPIALVLGIAAAVKYGAHHSPVGGIATVPAVQSPLSLFESSYRQANRYFDMGRYDQAAETFQKALLHGHAVGEESDEYKHCLAYLAASLRQLPNRKLQAKEIEAELSRIEKFSLPLGTIDSNNKEISRLNLQQPQTAQTKKNLCKILINQATLYNMRADYKLALDTAESALAIADEANARGKALSIMVAAATTAGDFDKAETYLQKLMDIAAQSRVDSALLAEAYLRAGRLHYLKASNSSQSGKPFDVAKFQPPDQEQSRKLEEASKELRCAAGLYKAIFGTPSPKYAECLLQLGLSLMRQGHFDDALSKLEEAKDMQSQLYGSESQQTANVLYNLAALKICMAEEDAAQSKREGLLRHADSYLAQADKIYSLRADDTENSIYLGETLNLEGLVAARRGDFVAAEQAYTASIKIARRWTSFCTTAATAYQRLIDLYRNTPLPENIRRDKISAAMTLVQDLKSPAPSVSSFDDLDAPIPAFQSSR